MSQHRFCFIVLYFIRNNIVFVLLFYILYVKTLFWAVAPLERENNMVFVLLFYILYVITLFLFYCLIFYMS
jgi:hypothetical protein